MCQQYEPTWHSRAEPDPNWRAAADPPALLYFAAVTARKFCCRLVPGARGALPGIRWSRSRGGCWVSWAGRLRSCGLRSRTWGAGWVVTAVTPRCRHRLMTCRGGRRRGGTGGAAPV